jgi:hypothetical protein
VLPPQVDGYARLEVLPPGDMLEAIASQVLAKMSDFSLHEVVKTLSGLSQVNGFTA